MLFETELDQKCIASLNLGLIVFSLPTLFFNRLTIESVQHFTMSFR